MRVSAIVISVLIGLVVGLGAAMLLAPAPNFQFFSAGVGAMEWAPWFLAAGLLGLLLAMVGLRGDSGAGRVAAGAALMLNLAAFLIIGWRFATALTTPPLVRSNMPAVTAGGPGEFSLGTFLRGNGVEPGKLTQRDLTYATVAGQELKLDVYRPASLADSAGAPAVVVVHGGSWRTGDKGDVPAFSAMLAGRGYAVFDVAYRLAPDARFPAAVSDVKCAIGYIKANAASFGIDPDRLVLLGRSAGAQIALVTAYAPDAAELPPSCPAGDTSVRGVIGYYAPTLMDYYKVIKPELSPGALDDYLGGPPENFAEVYRLSRPASWLGPNTPPTLLLHGSRDQFVRPADSAAIADELDRLGRPYAFVELPWANHGFDFNLDGTNNQLAQPYVDRFLNEVLKDK
jgi:acetyl esterase/lipase